MKVTIKQLRDEMIRNIRAKKSLNEEIVKEWPNIRNILNRASKLLERLRH
jgi:hypothetical protein